MILNTDNFWIRSLPEISSIATLGPEGTSSQSAAKYLTNLIGKPLDTLLFDTFELAFEYVENNESCIFLVANAYQRVDNFYMNKNTLLLGSFFYSPPDYYLGCKTSLTLEKKIAEKKTIKIATHHAPLSRLQSLIESAEDKISGITDAHLEIEITNSTSNGARLVVNGDVDCCLANSDAIKHYGLTAISHPLHIEMTWGVFFNSQIHNRSIA
ncbi:prephenate dehydratase domain-containing protein [Xenorhabdus stockiae]|uniref:prephenate dehydratase domain-containing protein n=1 Tax=Xenorhabdus stockiae TaxID=351614 RepID=UPI003CF9FE4D